MRCRDALEAAAPLIGKTRVLIDVPPQQRRELPSVDPSARGTWTRRVDPKPFRSYAERLDRTSVQLVGEPMWEPTVFGKADPNLWCVLSRDLSYEEQPLFLEWAWVWTSTLFVNNTP